MRCPPGYKKIFLINSVKLIRFRLSRPAPSHLMKNQNGKRGLSVGKFKSAEEYFELLGKDFPVHQKVNDY